MTAPDPVRDFCVADKAAGDHQHALLLTANSFAECERLLRSDATLAELNAEAGRCWRRLPPNLRAVVLNPNRRRV